MMALDWTVAGANVMATAALTVSLPVDESVADARVIVATPFL